MSEDSGYRNDRDRSGEVAPLAPRAFLRWTWRQLTSMRTALVLLFLLALGAVPGSVVPQDAVSSFAAATWRDQHPKLTPVYEKLGLFHVYSSPWFSAIYLLLMVSLVGCILPRTKVYAKAMRARPPRTPRHLTRLPEYRTFLVDAEPEAVLEKARTALSGYRSDRHPDSLAAERGYLREAGNLLFHLAVLIVLVGFGAGSLLGYKGAVVVVTGGQFANVSSQYDDFTPGGLFEVKNLAPFSFTVDDFNVSYSRDERNFAMASDFSAGLTYATTAGGTEHQARISVNHPLSIDGAKVYLIGHGYAPDITVRDGKGNVAFSGPVVFKPQDQRFFTSFGVVKVPEARPQQLGFQGQLYPTAGFSMATGPFSAFPDDKLPLLSMQVFAGDLGLDGGVPQSVYALDTTHMKPVVKDGKPIRVDLAPGAGMTLNGKKIGNTVTLPDGLGSITFNGVQKFVQLQVSHNPADGVALAGVVLALLGLLGSLFIKPRRIWVSARRSDGRTVVEVAGLDRSAGGDLSGEVDDLAKTLEES
jgi:cytochrome c biogenesis protein